MLQLNSHKRTFILLIVVSVLTLIPFLGLTDFHTKGEPREAIVPSSMLKTGNWILPINNGGDIAYKPPFFHWSIAATSLIGGEVTEFTSRFPSAIALIAMVLVGFLFYAKRKNTDAALIASLITLTAFEVHRAGMNCRVDMVLTAFIVLALYKLYEWCEHDMKGIPLLAIIFMGLATLTKGPIGIILPCLVTGIYLIIKGTKFKKAFFKLLLIGSVSTILPAIWYLLAYQQGGNSFINLIFEENIGRFTGDMSYESHVQPFTYNFLTAVVGFLPWTLLVIFSLFGVKMAKPRGKIKESLAKLKNSIVKMDSVRLFSFLSIVIIFVFYCIPKSKRSVYLLPIYPFIAYFLAEYFIYLRNQYPKAIKAFGIFLSSLFFLIIIALAAIKLGFIPESMFHGKHAVENLSYLNALKGLSPNLWNILFIFIPLLPIILFFREMNEKTFSLKPIYIVLSIMITLQLSFDAIYQPVVLNTKSMKGFALEVKRIVPNGTIYSYVSPGMMRFFVVNFYNDDRVALINKELPKEGYMLVGENDFKQFRPKYENKYSFKEIMRTNKKGNDVNDIIYFYKFSGK